MVGIRKAWVLLLLPLLSACILVEDFGASWNKGVYDSCMGRISESLYYTEFRRDPAGKDMGNLARTFSMGDKHFLMLKMEPTDKGGRMYRFGVTNGIFQRFRLDPVMKATFLKEYPKAPVSLKNDTVSVASLTPEVEKMLGEIAAKAEYWEIEDQSLYNTLRSTACLYEDRDLAALEAAAKNKKQ